MTTYRFKPVRRSIFINVELTAVNGESTEAEMLVDTGASVSAIPEKLALRLGLVPKEPGITVKSVDREMSFLTVVVPKIQLAEAKLVDVRMVCLPSSRRFEPTAILGLDVLLHFDISLHPARGELELTWIRIG